VGNIGAVLLGMGRLEDAITALQDAAAILRQTGDRHGEGITLSNLGFALLKVARLEDAIAALQDAATILRATEDKRSERVALGASKPQGLRWRPEAAVLLEPK
jgi:hypothetical protein